MPSTETRLAIAELLAKASYGYDERDLDLLESVLCEEAVMSVRIAGGDLMGPFEGRAAIMQLYRDSMASQNDVRRHVVSNSICTDAGADADNDIEVTSNLTLFATADGVTRLLTTGIYHDVVRATDDGWRILTRHVDLDSAY